MASRSKGWRKVTRRDSPVLIIDFYYLDPNGQRQRFRRDASVQTVTATVAEARRLQALAAEHGRVEEEPTPTKKTGKGLTFAEFIAGDFETIFQPMYKTSTRRRYGDLNRQILIPEIGSTVMAAFGASEYRALGANLVKRGIQNKGPLNLVRTLLRAAHEVGTLDAVPNLPSLVRAPKKLPKAPSAQDVADLIGQAKPWIAVVVGLAAWGGLRSGEIRGLEVGDVNLSRRVIHVVRAMSDDDVTTTKSDQERTVPIPEPLAALLTPWVKGQPPSRRVCLNSRGKTPNRQNILNGIRVTQKRAHLPKWTLHAFRHYFCSELVRLGVSAEVVRVLAGHSAISVTARYLHATDADLRAASTALGSRQRVGNTENGSTVTH